MIDAKNQFPPSLKPLFWSYDFEKLDLQRNKKSVIIQVINYGSLKDWRWLIKTYGKEEIRGFIERTPVSEFRPRALKLISLLLGINKFSHAPRGAH